MTAEACQAIFGGGDAAEEIRQVISRLFLHEEMKMASGVFSSRKLGNQLLEPALGGTDIPEAVIAMAETFISLQEERHVADYDLAASFRRADVLGSIGRVEAAIEGWKGARLHAVARLYLLTMLHWKRMKEKHRG